ncbi:MAG: fructose-bisphosphatase class III, partial [Oscillospiraceae bacterium]|nr:fructose-bisphosphatase class III [Oscillospiraceae bacterium]
MDDYNIKYLNMLSEQFPTIQKASCEIIRLTAQKKLPKLTEHFMSDI